MLWCAMRSIMKHKPDATIVLFTDLPPKPKCLSSASISSISSSTASDEEEGEECSLSGDEDFWSQYMIDRASNKFGVELPSKVKVVEVKSTALLDPSLYPRFTLLLQSLSSIIPGVEALFKLTPQVYIDTCGVPFVLPFARLFGCRTACYVHYPVISTDMLERVKKVSPRKKKKKGKIFWMFPSLLTLSFFFLAPPPCPAAPFFLLLSFFFCVLVRTALTLR